MGPHFTEEISLQRLKLCILLFFSCDKHSLSGKLFYSDRVWDSVILYTLLMNYSDCVCSKMRGSVFLLNVGHSSLCPRCIFWPYHLWWERKSEMCNLQLMVVSSLSFSDGLRSFLSRYQLLNVPVCSPVRLCRSLWSALLSRLCTVSFGSFFAKSVTVRAEQSSCGWRDTRWAHPNSPKYFSAGSSRPETPLAFGYFTEWES